MGMTSRVRCDPSRYESYEVWRQREYYCIYYNIISISCLLAYVSRLYSLLYNYAKSQNKMLKESIKYEYQNRLFKCIFNTCNDECEFGAKTRYGSNLNYSEKFFKNLKTEFS